MKKAMFGLLITFLIFIGGLFWLASGEGGGTDIPLSQPEADSKCQMWLPVFADSIYCRWWTGGTQEWEHQARFWYPEIKEKDWFDSLVRSKFFNTWEKNRIQLDSRIEYAMKMGKNKMWWNLHGKNLVHFGPDSVRNYGRYIWVDTTNNYVYWFSR